LTALREEPVFSEVLSKGYAIIPGFWNAKQCESARASIDNWLLGQNSNRVKVWSDPLNADKRIMGSHSLCKSLDLFSDQWVTSLMTSLYGSRSLNGFTMASRIQCVPGNLGSGQGWHRDSCVEHQFKAILYLSHVTKTSGPFQYFRYSGNPQQLVAFSSENRIDFDENRLDQYESAFNHSEIDEICGAEGTLIIANTRGIHRGKPIEKGTRYSLTNYYWRNEIPEHINAFVNYA
jgi:hypothetical protein